MRIPRNRLLGIAEIALGTARRADSAEWRDVAVLRAQACVAAASLAPEQVVGEHAPDAIPFVRGREIWPDPRSRSL